MASAQWGQSGPQAPYEPYRHVFTLSNGMILLVVFLGTILLVIGAILFHAAGYDGVEADTANNLMATGRILFDIGIYFIIAITVLVVALRNDISERARLGLAIFAALAILEMIYTTFFTIDPSGVLGP